MDQGMEEFFAMKGGDGVNSYTRNSQIQKKGFDEAKVLSRNTIQEKHTMCTTPVFSIADLGCSVGPNTFACVQSIIEAVKLKFQSQGLNETQLPEFQVFFNDHVSNDFNTLFKTFPVDRAYIGAGVPGCFHGRLFPKVSMNLMHTAFSMNGLSRIPEQVTKKGSPAWNNGRITCVSSSKEVGEAYAAQFQSDMVAFFAARYEELADDGPLAILTPCRPESTLPSDSFMMQTFECLGQALADMVKEGLVREDLTDSFNLPLYIPSASEVKQAMVGMKNLQMSIESSKELRYPTPKLDTPGGLQTSVLHIRAVTEVLVSKHFGSELDTNELFQRYQQKLDQFSKTPRFVSIQKLENLYLLVKRNAVSNDL